MKPPITIFMGSPEFAVPVLKALVEEYPIAGVVTQPDRPAGRGRQLTAPPVKLAAQALGLPVIQPARLRQPEAMEQMRAWSPELIVVAAFGQILRLEVLELPRFGCINVHASLLPRWRGAAPINAAIFHGDETTGVTIMHMDAGVDTGLILRQKAVSIHPDDTTGSLSSRLADTGAELLIETLPHYISGNLKPTPQDETLATYAPMLKKEDGRLDFSCPAADLARKVRAYNPWPGTFLESPAGSLKVHRARAETGGMGQPGERCTYDGMPAVITANGILVLDEVQPAGKKIMPGKVFLQGARGWE